MVSVDREGASAVATGNDSRIMVSHPGVHAEPLPPAPAYGRSSIADLLTSSAAALGVAGFTNVLGLPAAPRICVVMVDGLGRALLKQRGGHAPFLRRALEGAATLSAAFPSTTATSLASMGTGLPPGSHGMVGYDVLDPGQDKVVNLLGGWDRNVDPLRWQPHPTVLERVAEVLPVTTVSLPRFEDSAMTKAALRGGSYVPAVSPQARCRAAADLLQPGTQGLVYLYWNELDKAGHRYGCQSTEWGHQLEELDSSMKRLAARLSPGTLLLLTADHGMLDVAPQHRFDYSLEPELLSGVRHTAGEPRMVHLYLEPDATPRNAEQLVTAWRERYGTRAWVMTRNEAVSAGYFGPVHPTVLPRIGDLLIAAREPVAFYDARRVNASALEVVGQHGSLTRAEREVPLLRLDQVSAPGRTSRG